MTHDSTNSSHFIREIVSADVARQHHGGRVATRFPPEPNGYLHIGHAKAICINFGLAREFSGTVHLRFDDTNPTTEDVEYVDAIQEDVRWLGFTWDALIYASDHFEALYAIAEKLILRGEAYVDSLSEAQIRDYRGDYHHKGRPSPFRDRPAQESLDLLRRMRQGAFKEGEHVLRAKIDLQSQNMNLRDPLLYRIRYAPHHRTKDAWCIYPLYDFAHPLCDGLEKITHSLCTVEFEAHRPLYDWCIEKAKVFASRQIEFARLNLTYTVLSKRKLAELVRNKHVSGWDDPRMPTLSGLRRLGYTADAIRNFCERIGVAKADSVVDVGLLEYCVREDLNRRAIRLMGVLQPLRLVIENIAEGEVREIDAPLYPDDATRGSRTLHLSRVLFIERDDFREDPPKDWFRLAPGRDVRLRYAGIIQCTDVVKDATGSILEIRCQWSAESVGRPPGKKAVRGTIHWVSAAHAVPVEVRLYDRLFKSATPGADPERNFTEDLNPDSLLVRTGCPVEPTVQKLACEPGAHLQLERLGYFCADKDSTVARPILNRTVTLKDTWAKMEAKIPQSVAADAAAKKTPQTMPTDDAATINIDEFAKVDLRVGLVRVAELVEGAKKLLRLEVDLGEGRSRQIFAGLRAHYPDPHVLVGQRVVVVANLKPRQMKFGLSEGMVLAAGEGEEPVRIITCVSEVQAPKPGTKVR